MPRLTVHPPAPRPAKLPPRPKSKPVRLYDRIWVVSPGAYARGTGSRGAVLCGLLGWIGNCASARTRAMLRGIGSRVDSETLRQCDRLGA